ncbi:MAG: hypothetical protein JW981_08155 [Anaerolineae bacterium]|nr:hypothetical protein [Anaerolineae bacterium]
MKKGGLLLLIGVVLGVAAGLTYAWVLNPVQYYDSYPAMLQADYRREWIAISVWAYSSQGNMARTQLRLKDLPMEEVQAGIAGVLDTAVAAGRPVQMLQRIAKLAQTYGVDTPAVQVYANSNLLAITPYPSITAEVALPTPTSTPILQPVALPAPTATPIIFIPTPTQVFTTPYYVQVLTYTCVAQPQIGVTVMEAVTQTVRGRERLEQEPLPGVSVWLLWDEGAERGVTGFKPEQGMGYVDFDVVPQQRYNLYVGMPGGLSLSTLEVRRCDSVTTTWEQWSLVIVKRPEDLP